MILQSWAAMLRNATPFYSIQQSADCRAGPLSRHASDSATFHDVRAPAEVIKAIRNSAQPLTGIMWHPERLSSAHYVLLFRRVFEVG